MARRDAPVAMIKETMRGSRPALFAEEATMRVDWKSMLLGAAVAVVALFSAGALLLHAGSGGSKEQRHRALRLASGRTLEVMELRLAFGDEHSQRGAVDDALQVEYVAPAAEQGARDRDAAEVFEAVRPLAEALGVGAASVVAFPSSLREGPGERHDYTRDSAGAWDFKRQ
jgi:hypothetical protein